MKPGQEEPRPVTDEERERVVAHFTRDAGFSRPEAEFAAAIELGEIDGDLVDLDAPRRRGRRRG